MIGDTVRIMPPKMKRMKRGPWLAGICEDESGSTVGFREKYHNNT
jgi:hypothetical protein